MGESNIWDLYTITLWFAYVVSEWCTIFDRNRQKLINENQQQWTSWITFDECD